MSSPATYVQLYQQHGDKKITTKKQKNRTTIITVELKISKQGFKITVLALLFCI